MALSVYNALLNILRLRKWQNTVYMSTFLPTQSCRHGDNRVINAQPQHIHITALHAGGDWKEIQETVNSGINTFKCPIDFGVSLKTQGSRIHLPMQET